MSVGEGGERCGVGRRAGGDRHKVQREADRKGRAEGRKGREEKTEKDM